MTLFGDRYRGRRVLLTGHTGFKGSWLALWLSEMGAQVTGVALKPWTAPNHWDLLGLEMPAHELDIRDPVELARLVQQVAPEIVFHLAAQPLVLRSYREPLETWSTNVMGTAHLLEACRNSDSVRAVVVVTTDKCYANREWVWGYRETDELGGRDPYSASKAASEFVVTSYRSSFFEGATAPLLATARAGNVIGGGDWAEDRLIPDLMRAIVTGKPLTVRKPDATRPWQHVLESLSGYLLLGQGLLEGRSDLAESWNFGPDPSANRSVADVLTGLRDHWPEITWETSGENQHHEANFLYLDSAKATSKLGWQPVLSLGEALKATADWYRGYYSAKRMESRSQLAAYISQAREKGLTWASE